MRSLWAGGALCLSSQTPPLIWFLGLAAGWSILRAFLVLCYCFDCILTRSILHISYPFLYFILPYETIHNDCLQEYVLVMVANKKSMTQIAHDLIDFIGDEAANEFVTWLSTALPTFETPTGSSEKSKVSAESSTNPINEIKRESSHEKKVKTSHTKTSKSTKKRDVKDESNHKSSTKSSTKTTIKLSRSKDQDIKQVLAKRSQRFGITKENTEDTRHEEGTNKRKSSKMDSNSQKKASRVTELLGPPVNVDQAQLDARDGRKHRRTRSRSPTRNTSDRTLTGTPQRSQRDSNTAEANTRQRRTGEWASTGKDKSMQSSSPSHEKMHKKRYEQHAYGYPVPRGFNGYPPMVCTHQVNNLNSLYDSQFFVLCSLMVHLALECFSEVPGRVRLQCLMVWASHLQAIPLIRMPRNASMSPWLVLFQCRRQVE